MLGMSSSNMPGMWVSVVVLWLGMGVANVDGAKYGSSSSRQGRLQGSVISTSTTRTAAMCQIKCCDNTNCKAYNHKKSSSTCELLSSRLCDDEVSALNTSDVTWRYYDMHTKQNEERSHLFHSHPMCSELGRCSPACERSIDEVCTEDIQCTTVAENTHCSNTTVPNTCICNEHYWKYNSTLCIHQTSLSSMTWTWIFLKIVNNMCSVTFTAKMQYDIHIHLGNLYTWHDGITEYKFIIGGWTNTWSNLYSRGVSVHGVATPQILTNDFQNFTMSWCNGQLRFAKQGEADFLFWDDPWPFGVYTLGLHTPYNTDSHLFFPHNLVDSYFPTSAETRTIQTNGHHFHQVKILPDASPTNNISFVFECKVEKDCIIMFALRTDHSQKYHVVIGAHWNADTLLYNGRTGSWVCSVSTLGIVSANEFRKFYINILESYMEVGKDGESPLCTYTDPDNIPVFTHVSVGTCCDDYGYWKIHSHPQFHDYLEGSYVLG